MAGTATRTSRRHFVPRLKRHGVPGRRAIDHMLLDQSASAVFSRRQRDALAAAFAPSPEEAI